MFCRHSRFRSPAISHNLNSTGPDPCLRNDVSSMEMMLLSFSNAMQHINLTNTCMIGGFKRFHSHAVRMRHTSSVLRACIMQSSFERELRPRERCRLNRRPLCFRVHFCLRRPHDRFAARCHPLPALRLTDCIRRPPSSRRRFAGRARRFSRASCNPVFERRALC